MDILIHTLSGSAVGGLIATISKAKPKQAAALIFFGAFAGAIPDIDAISLWSGFDETIGKWLGLTHSGSQIYFGKFWYSHHAFTHSLLWCLMFGIATYLSTKLLFKSAHPLGFSLVAAFGSLAHILGDLPTPSGSWGGVALLFPSDQYVGGWGKIWWWNNYDIFLILAFLNLGLIGTSLFRTHLSRLVAPIAFVACLAMIIRQVNTRAISSDVIHGNEKYVPSESKSKDVQRSILGDKLYNRFENFDKALPFYF